MRPENLISVYTREQAIEDGVLIPVDELAFSLGFRLPSVVAHGLYSECLDWARHEGREVIEIIEEVLRLALKKILTLKDGETDRVNIDLPWRPGRYFIAHIGPGDHGEPVMTFMMPEDD